VTLPGADELFRTTGGAALQAPQPRQQPQQHTGGEAQGDTRPRTPGKGEAPDGGPEAAGDGAERDSREGRGPADGGAGPAAEHTGRRPLAGQGGAPAAGVNGSAQTAAPPAHVPQQQAAPAPPPATAQPSPQQPQAQPGTARRKTPRQNRRPSGRERHDEKITVYVSAEELMDLEHARLVLRGEHGLAIDRGRIVREAVAVVLADLESRGDASILVRRLRGR
jgi:hypothetical protein